MHIAAVIPAYNEEATIGAVLDVVRTHPLIREIIVVSDGSTDCTAAVARKRKEVQVIELDKNRGKGGALMVGIKATDARMLLFLDADLIGLQKAHLDNLLQPLMESGADMVIGLFKEGRMATDLALKVAPHLAGQRALKRNIIDEIDDLEMTRFGVEVALNNYVKENNCRLEQVYLKDLTHVMKEEKRGLIRGVASRLQMYWDIVKNIILRHEKPRN